ncbi:armadillo-type protein [Mycena galopus ATCC 62051]|nr:armadillo-type protein [Mycena galopus ATCC 62051]
MLESPDRGARIGSCRLLRSLASQTSIAPAILELKPHETLVSLLGDKRLGVIREASAALCEISDSIEGAQTIVNSMAMNHIFVLLQSLNPETRLRTCEVAAKLATHESTVPAILRLCVPIVSLLRDKESRVIRQAAYTLCKMARWEEGAQTVVNAKAMDHISMLLESPNLPTRLQACQLVDKLASHESIVPAISKLPIMSLLSDKKSSVIEFALSILSRMAHWEEGARIILNAKATHHILMLLEKDSRLIQFALSLLSGMAQREDGAHAIVNAKAMDHISMLLESPNLPTRLEACQLVDKLASHGSIVPALSKLPIVSLLRIFGH